MKFEYAEPILDSDKNTMEALFCAGEIMSILIVNGLYMQIFNFITSEKFQQACHATDPHKINIHMIAHTHDDVGWLKTADQYYYGSNKGHSPAGVQYILDSVASELVKNSARRFVYVETAFFWAWWDELDENDRTTVKTLVEEGRLEFLHGGWCMSDEATPHYSAMIDQMTLGLKFLNDTFGECGRPTTAWQIDPFGHSSEVAIEFAEMGFDGLFVGRIDHDDHKTRKSSKTMEMIWKPDPSLGEAGELFTSVLYDLYTAPPGFCFDVFCSDEPIMDNKKLHGYNVDERVKRFESIMKEYSSVFKSRHVAVTFGNDFTYSVASAWFKNMDKLIKYTNNRSTDFNLLYSTPSCYLQAINSQNLTWPAKEDDDFFPYASDEHSYWTGYFTSRPAFKLFVYYSNNILQMTKQLATVIGEKLFDEEFYFKRAVGISQHHDGVSGTEKQHVTDDYALYLDEGLEKGKQIITEVYRDIYGEQDFPEQNFCTLRNISQCSISESGQSFVVIIYNPLSRRLSFPIKVPVTNDFSHHVYLQNGTEIEIDLVPIPEQVSKIPGRTSKATHDLIFIAKDLPPLGIVSYYIEVEKGKNNPTDKNIQSATNDTVILDNGIIKLVFNKTDGMLQSASKNGVTWPLHQNFYYYNATKGYNYNAESRASGAYIFRPTSTEPQAAASSATITQYQGNNVFEVHQKFNDWISQVVRLYKNVSDIEFEWVVGEIPINDWTGLEVVTKYLTDIPSNGTFYTDSNGRRWMKRIRDYRKYWNLSTSTETVSRNYYPLTSAICLRDSSKQVTVLTDRPEGGTSMRNGEIEIMLHRRLLYDDNKGVVEPLDELAFGKALVVRGRHTLQINNLTAADAAHRFKAVESQYAPISTLSKTPFTRDQWVKNYSTKKFSVITSELPPNVHLLTLERWRKDQILLRLEHLFQANETSEYAKPVNVDIKDLFTLFNVNKITELSLAANWEKSKLQRLRWQSQGSSNKVSEAKDTNTTTLQPMQIRTFLLDVGKK
ncbi:hypothetical protein V9T40_009441 [Parthenolecanium corni]|uniref:Alpha-mannosidase n=1 Tax=Parthenolecanium corni TaxID=536013 RepID=A0AAN9Y923_9HEMI